MIEPLEVTEAEWPAFAARYDDFGHEQSLAYARAAAARVGARNRFVTLEEDGVPIAAACVRIRTLPVLGRGLAYIAAGPLTRRDGAVPDADRLVEILAALRRRFAEAEGHVLRIRLPAHACPPPAEAARVAERAGFAPTDRIAAYRSFALDLTQDMDVLMKRLDGKWRTELRQALKAGLEIERGTGPELEDRFQRMLDEVQAAKGFEPGLPPEFFHALEGPDFREEILIATKDGEDAAGIVTGTSGKLSVYLLGATAEPGRRSRAGYLLTWEAIRLAQERGCLWYDLGGADEASNPGVHRFKKRMNGAAIEAGGFEARPVGLASALIGGAERLRARMKGRR